MFHPVGAHYIVAFSNKLYFSLVSRIDATMRRRDNQDCEMTSAVKQYKLANYPRQRGMEMERRGRGVLILRRDPNSDGAAKCKRVGMVVWINPFAGHIRVIAANGRRFLQEHNDDAGCNRQERDGGFENDEAGKGAPGRRPFGRVFADERPLAEEVDEVVDDYYGELLISLMLAANVFVSFWLCIALLGVSRQETYYYESSNVEAPRIRATLRDQSHAAEQKHNNKSSKGYLNGRKDSLLPREGHFFGVSNLRMGSAPTASRQGRRS